MNNDLDRFSEEYLKELINSPADELTIALARIALSAKQAKPIAYTDNLSLETLQGNGMACMWKEGNGAEWREQIPLYTTPQPAHTEQDGWKLVPIEATREMIWAGKENISIVGCESFQRAYQAMLAAAPKPENE